MACKKISALENDLFLSIKASFSAFKLLPEVASAKLALATSGWRRQPQNRDSDCENVLVKCRKKCQSQTEVESGACSGLNQTAETLLPSSRGWYLVAAVVPHEPTLRQNGVQQGVQTVALFTSQAAICEPALGPVCDVATCREAVAPANR